MRADERFFLVADDPRFSWLKMPELQTLFALLNRDGHEVRVVGGAVRNALIGEKVGDLDCACTAEPKQVMAWAEEANLHAIPTGIDHGTVTVVIDHHPFEVTALRKDVETFGRHAKVAFGGDWGSDAHRRDFTMNALYVDVDGRLYDPTGSGVSDARVRCVRFIGKPETRIAEDYLRVLRFFRFYAHYGKQFNKVDYHACIAAQKDLRSLSGERVGAEMTKLLAGPYAAKSLKVMLEGGMLPAILRSVPHVHRFERLVALMSEMNRSANPALALTALCVETSEDAHRVAKVLRLPNRLRDRMVRLISHVRSIDAVSEEDLQKLAYRHGKALACDLVILALVRHQVSAELTSLSMIMRNIDHWEPPVFPLSGRDLISNGVKPGPKMGETLSKLEGAWVSSGFALSKGALLSKKVFRR